MDEGHSACERVQTVELEQKDEDRAKLKERERNHSPMMTLHMNTNIARKCTRAKGERGG